MCKKLLVLPKIVKPREFPQNRFAECISLAISSTNVRKNKFDVLLTINFNDQLIKFGSIGEVRFGLRGGELKFKISNGCIPLKNRTEKNVMDLKLRTKRTITETDAQNIDTEVSQSAGLTIKGLKINRSEKGKKNLAEVGETKDEISINTWQVTTKGSDENPVWAFDCKKSKDDILKEYLLNHKLGTVLVSERPCTLEANFLSDVQKIKILLYTRNLISKKDLTNNKLSVIKIILKKMFLKKIFENKNGILSQDIIRYV